MNLNFTKSNRATLMASIVCLLTITISACSKSNTTPNTAVPYDIVSVIYASPDAPAADFYVNNSQVNVTALTAGNYIPYFKCVTGSVKAGFFDTGGLTPIATDTLNLKQNMAYTLFFANTAAKHDFVFVTDTLVAPVNNGASIRLANMSPDAGNVDLMISGKVIVANKSYKQVSSFTPITIAGNDTLKIVKTGTKTVLGAVNAVTVQSGAVYTIWLYGLANGTSAQALNANLMENAIYN